MRVTLTIAAAITSALAAAVPTAYTSNLTSNYSVATFIETGPVAEASSKPLTLASDLDATAFNLNSSRAVNGGPSTPEYSNGSVLYHHSPSLSGTLIVPVSASLPSSTCLSSAVVTATIAQNDTTNSVVAKARSSTTSRPLSASTATIYVSESIMTLLTTRFLHTSTYSSSALTWIWASPVNSESTSAPSVVIAYVTTTVTASPVTPHLLGTSTVTFTVSRAPSQQFYAPSISANHAADITYSATYTYTLYKSEVVTLTKTQQPWLPKPLRPSASSEHVASPIGTSTKQKVTTTIGITFTSTIRPTSTRTLSSALSSDSIPLQESATLSLMQFDSDRILLEVYPTVFVYASSSLDTTPSVTRTLLSTITVQSRGTSSREKTLSTPFSSANPVVPSSSAHVDETTHLSLASKASAVESARTTNFSRFSNTTSLMGYISESNPAYSLNATNMLIPSSVVKVVSTAAVLSSSVSANPSSTHGAFNRSSQTSWVTLSIESSSSTSNGTSVIVSSVSLTSAISSTTNSATPTLSSSMLFTNNTGATSSAIPSSALCGESGNFTLTWDDEPSFNPSGGVAPDPLPPVFNPYHHLFFASGYSYISDEREDVYSAVSEPTLAVWVANRSDVDTGSPNAGSQGLNALKPGEIGAGPRAFSDAYWFNAYGAFFGCLADGSGVCQLVVNGYAWEESKKSEVLRSTQTYPLPTCAGFKDCKMTPIIFNTTDFEGLSGIQFQAAEYWTNGTVQWKDFMIDSLSMEWFNNSCAAGLLRISQRK